MANPMALALLKQALERRGKRRRRRVPKRPEGTTLKRQYQRDINVLLAPARTLVNEVLVPEIGALERLAGIRDAANFDVETSAEMLRRLMGDVVVRYGRIATDQRVASIAANQAGQLNMFHRRAHARQMKTLLGIDVFALDPDLTEAISGFTTENVGLIKSISESYFAEIENLALRNLRAGIRAESWASELVKRYQVAESRAALIARDQTNKFNGELTRHRQTELGIGFYIWRTSDDERVRATHQALEGRLFSWTDPQYAPPEGHPGHPIQCRCQAEPDIETSLRLLEAA